MNMNGTMIDEIARAIGKAKCSRAGTADSDVNAIFLQYQDMSRAAMEAIAVYYEGALDKVGYGNMSATAEEYARAKTVAQEMRRILEKYPR